MAGIGKLVSKLKYLSTKNVVFSGTVKVEGSFAARVVNLYKEQTGEFIDSTLSNSDTGAWSIEVCDNTNVKYYAVCVALSGSRNNEIISHIVGM